MSKKWFAVDKAGLGRILERKALGFVAWELVQNAWDEDGVTRVDIRLAPVAGRPEVTIRVEDDAPEGFHDLSHAWTLFADSRKKADPTKRGRFNFGDKLVLARCEEAEITTTKGSVAFGPGGRRRGRTATAAGSVFWARLRMTREHYGQLCGQVRRLLPPEGIETVFNGEAIPRRKPVATFYASLETEVADGEGVLREARRCTDVEVYEPLPGEDAYLYEMGIPVVPTGDRFHVNVLQKIPLNMDRENVPSGFLRQIRGEVLNATAGLLTAEDATAGWVTEATESYFTNRAALESVVRLRFGDRRAAYDPSDPEASKRCVAAGMTVVSGGSLTAQQWERIRQFDLLPPAGKVMPTARPYSAGAPPERVVPEEEWTPGMQAVAALAQRLAFRLMGVALNVRVVCEPAVSWVANYGDGHLCLNLGRLGHAWFDGLDLRQVLPLLIHELAHEYCGDHLSDAYHTACCSLGADAVALALEDPEAVSLRVPAGR